MLTITKIFEFDSAHRLPEYKGKCNKIHGHRWKLEVEVTGKIQDYGSCAGMIADFSVLKDIVEDEIISIFDHTYINDVIPNPTAELMIVQIMANLMIALPKISVELRRLRLWETPTSYVEWKK